MMNTASLPHPPHLVYQAWFAGEEKYRNQDEKNSYQTLHFYLRHLARIILQTFLLVPPPGKGHGANLKGASCLLKPFYFLWLPHTLSPWPDPDQNLKTTLFYLHDHHHHCPSWSFIFEGYLPFNLSLFLFAFSSTLSRVLFLSTNSHPRGWATDHSEFPRPSATPLP